MVYKARFLKKRVVDSYDPSADETYTVELSDQALAAVWIGIKADLVADEGSGASKNSLEVREKRQPEDQDPRERRLNSKLSSFSALNNKSKRYITVSKRFPRVQPCAQ